MKRTRGRAADDVRKRAFDVTCAILVLLVTAPLQVSAAIAVAISAGRPILFRQKRVGKDGVVFTLVKFRSMIQIDADRGMITDGQRLTHIGRLLRSTSIDELPSLVNVVRGDMSLVGPRPLLVKYLARYTPEQSRRHEVKPGITGLAQVSGRNAIDWDRKLELDVEYVDTRTFGLDLQILCRTALSVWRRDGVSRAGHATTHEFEGTLREKVDP